MKNNFSKFNTMQISKKRKIIYSISTIIMILIIIFFIGEILIRIFNPQVSLYPRWKFSFEYGQILYPNRKMVHTQPGKWKFIYTVNELGYRGKPVPISDSYHKENIVILGDSYSFGNGVNDGEEYSAIMNVHLKNNFNVINLSSGGWGLTQEIRKFYEFGQLYLPKTIILQFSSNDPLDNLQNKVTVIKNDRFKFQNTNNVLTLSKKYLSNCIIQKSQVYNLFRNAAYFFIRKKIIRKQVLINKKKNNQNYEIQFEQKYYNDLLELFANDLKKRKIILLMIAVNNQLDKFPYIKEKITELDTKGLLKYIEVVPWFENVENYSSPEGHYWGKKAHYIIGTRLSKIIKDQYLHDEKEASILTD